MDRQGHGQAAADQDDRVNSAEQNVQVMTRRSPSLRILEPIDAVPKEQSAEKHHFGQQKQPHSKRRGFLLLLHIDEVMAQFGMMRVLNRKRLISHSRPRFPAPGVSPALQSRKPLRSRWALLRNSRSAAATAFSIPNRSRPKDSPA